jgi:hypothetical protein
MYVDPGHHSGVVVSKWMCTVLVNLVVLEMMILAVSSGVVFRLWCLVYSERKAPPVMITNNLNQEFTVPLWSCDVGILFLVSVSGKTAVNSCTDDGVEVCKRGFDGSWDWCDLFRLVPGALSMDYKVSSTKSLVKASGTPCQ